MEFLRREGRIHGGKSLSSDLTNFSGFSNVLHLYGFDIAPRSIHDDANYSRTFYIAQPIFRVTSFKNSSYASDQTEHLFETAFSCWTKKAVAIYPLELDGIHKPKSKDALLLSTLESLRVGFHVDKTPAISAVISSIREEHHNWSIPQRFPIPLQKDPSCSIQNAIPSISSPVLQRHMPNISGFQRFYSNGNKAWPPKRIMSTVDWETGIFSLSRFRRPQLSVEGGIWSSGSRDILRKSRYKRQKLLMHVPRCHEAVISLTEPLCVNHSAEGKEETIIFSFLFSLHRKLRYIDSLQGADRLKLSSAHGVVENENGIPSRASEETIQGRIEKYDPPKRRRSPVLRETILSRYEHVQRQAREDSLSRGNEHSSSKNADGDNDSDASILDDVLFLSGDEFGEEVADRDNGLGALIQMETTNRECRKHMPGRHDFQSRESGQDMLQVWTVPDQTVARSHVRLKVPENLVCSPWTLKVADHCLRALRRGIVFLPSPLSALPLITVLTNCYLSGSMRDQRVAVVCESSSDVTFGVHSYISSGFDKAVSFDTVRRSEYPSSPKRPSAKKANGRVVIFDSFDFSPGPGFTFLIVIINEPSFRSPPVSGSINASHTSLGPNWSRIPNILVVPLAGWVSLVSFLEMTGWLSVQLRLDRSLVLHETDDVLSSVLLARPRAMFLVPSREAIELVEGLDSHSSAYLPVFDNARKARSLNSLDGDAAATCTLKDVSVSLLQELLEGETLGAGAGTNQRLELLYNLRQARSYALHDGFEVALEFLRHCEKRAPPEALKILRTVVEQAEDGLPLVNGNRAQEHPMLAALIKSMRRSQSELRNEAPSLKSIHRRNSFQPLIVANSLEASRVFLTEIENTIQFGQSKREGIVVCWFQDLMEMSNLKGHDRNAAVGEMLDSFSHVFHVADDREDVNPEVVLPPRLMQFVHAGRTHLLTIVVDETRKRDLIWEENEVAYSRLGEIVQSFPVQSEKADVAYMQDISAKELIAKVGNANTSFARPMNQRSNAVLSGQGFYRTKKSSTLRPSQMMKAQVDISTAPGCLSITSCHLQAPSTATPRSQHTTDAQENGTYCVVYLEPAEIIRCSISAMRAQLEGHLKALKPPKTMLKVIVQMRPHERCTPAVTYVHAALGTSALLHEHTVVESIFRY